VQYDDGKMDGFYESNQGDKGEVIPDPATDLRSGERAMTWYDEREIPYYYALAKAFGIGDHYFCSLLGPTWPNRMYLFAGTSFGLAGNTFADVSAHPFPQSDAVVLDELDKRHVDWKLYTGGGPPGVATVLGVGLPTRYGERSVLFTMDDFFRDAAEGKLPPVVYLDANFTKTGDPDSEDEHPPSNPQLGQRFTSKIVDALFKSPQWGKLAFFMTYDEHGGIYDHVPPPKACAPDAKPPEKNGQPLTGAFDRYGMRVPFLVVSPYAKRGYVSHGVYDHTSILRFIQAKHRLPALTARDANAAIPTDFFDFQSPPNLAIPQLPEAVVDPAEKQYCETTFAR
jgi:phospholipase C